MITTVRGWAEMMGISRQAAYRAVTRCEIPIDDCGGIDADEATQLYRERTRPRANRPRTTLLERPIQPRGVGECQGDRDAHRIGQDATAAYWVARVRREQAQAELAELELARARGTLVDIGAVRAEFARRTVGARDLLLSVAARLAPVVTAESDLRRVRELLDAEMRRALSMLSGEDEVPRHDLWAAVR